MKKVLSLLIVMILAFSMVACGNNENVNNNVANETPVNETPVNETPANEDVVEEVVEEPAMFEAFTFTDGKGREVTISEEPMTVVSIAPSMTEFVYALGLGDRLLGRTDYCNFPEEVMNVESIGSLTEPNVEAIVAMNPDLVLMSTHAGEEVVLKLEEAGLNVVILSAQESFEGVYEIYGQMGMIFNVSDKADMMIQEMKDELASVLTKLEGVEAKTVYYVVGSSEWGEYTATGDTFIHEMILMAGGDNIASEAVEWSYNIESIVENDPEFIICSELNDMKASLEAKDGYMDLTAVKEGKLFTINQDLLSRQGPRLAKGVVAIAEILHPELFE